MENYLRILVFPTVYSTSNKGIYTMTIDNFKYKTGDMFQSNATYFVNAVNTVGTSGKGLALQVKRLYPESVVEYEKACKTGNFKVGDVLIAPTNDGKHIIHFPTKKHWKNQSQYQYIEEGLDALHLLCLEIPNGAIIAIPQLGCGLGGLDWSRVHKLIVTYLSDIKHITFYIYGPNIMD